MLDFISNKEHNGKEKKKSLIQSFPDSDRGGGGPCVLYFVFCEQSVYVRERERVCVRACVCVGGVRVGVKGTIMLRGVVCVMLYGMT